MKVLRRHILTIAMTVGLLVWPSSTFADHVALQKNQILVTGVVPDRRMIVVNPDLSIAQMYSNTRKDVTPTVTLGSITGTPMTLTASVRDEYLAVLHQLKANKVVSITAVYGHMPNVYPNFVAPGKITVYTVKPTAMLGDETPQIYTVSTLSN